MVETALTPEQQRFATEHHTLVYTFLNDKKLREDDYYDIVVFGFLRAVRRYLEESHLQKYAFSTIAWSAMQTNLYNHHRCESRQKRKAQTVSLDTMAYDNDEILPFQEALSAPDPSILDFETELLMLELASRVSKREMDIVRMKANGYGTREIAKAQQMPMKGVTKILAGLENTVLAVCYGQG